MKKEEQNFGLRQADHQLIPPWLSTQQPILGAGPGPPPSSSQTVDLSSSSSSIFNTRLDQFTHQNPNPNNLGPTIPPPPHPFQQTTIASPHMSATALLQKAAQMGATMSTSKTSNTTGSSSSSSSHAFMIRPHQQAHVSAPPAPAADYSGNNTTTKTVATTPPPPTTIAGFGLNLSSREGFIHGLTSFGNKAAAAAAIPSASSASASAGSGVLLQEMMNSFSTGYGANSSFDETFGGILNSKKDTTTSHSRNGHLNQEINNGEELTRDFLGLGAFSQTDILNIAALGNCINTEQQQQQNHSQKPWQG